MQSLNPWRVVATQPPKVESDEVFPLHFLDSHMSSLNMVLTQTLLFNVVLDATKLHDGLAKLISKGDRRKLGGRLCKKVSTHLSFVFEHSKN